MSHRKYLGSDCRPVSTEAFSLKQPQSQNHSTEENKMTIDATVNNTVETASEVVSDKVETAAPAVKGGLKARKEELSDAGFNWMSVAGTGLIAGIGSVANMLVVNAFIKDADKEDATPYTVLEIAGVSAATALVASASQAVVQKISDRVNNDAYANLISTSAISNGAIVASAFGRNHLINMVRGISLDSYMDGAESDNAQ